MEVVAEFLKQIAGRERQSSLHALNIKYDVLAIKLYCGVYSYNQNRFD
jgi:hypothetical protein